MLESIAAIAGAISGLVTLGYKLAKLYKEAKAKGWIEKNNDLSQAIAEAKTDEERRKLARALFNNRA